MYKEHATFNPPQDDAVLWRYMDFTKFISLLESRALFFARADKLGDPFEGAPSIKNKEFRIEAYLNQPPEHNPLRLMFSEDQWKKISEEHVQESMAHWRKQRKFILINCWHESSHESAAMWRLYARETDGIAVKTDFSSFKRSFKCSEDIYVGRVEYVDYEKTLIPEYNLFSSYLHKRQDFKHEQEVRAITMNLPKTIEEADQPLEICEVGRNREVDFSLLIKEVIVAPYADDWFLELIQSVAVNRFGLEVPVVRSDLAQKPIWE